MRGLVVLLALVAACTRRDAPEDHAAAPVVPGVETAPAVQATLDDEIRAFGVIAADDVPPAVRDARTALAEAEARQRLASEQLRRLTDLARGAVAPRKELDAARAEEATAAALAARARQTLAAFGAAAPSVEPGAGPWLIAQVAQPDVAHVRAGAPARFTPDAYRDRTLAARVLAPPAYVDPTTGTAPVRLQVDDPDHLLRPGMTGAVALDVPAPEPVVVVPSASVLSDGDHRVVFVRTDDGHFAARVVQPGVTRDGRTALASGVAPGDQVATTGAASLLSATRLPAGADD